MLLQYRQNIDELDHEGNDQMTIDGNDIQSRDLKSKKRYMLHLCVCPLTRCCRRRITLMSLIITAIVVLMLFVVLYATLKDAGQ